jgi:O-antigen ligase
LWLYVFTVPWDVVPLPGVGALARLVGIVAISVVVLTVIAQGRFRQPDMILTAAVAFTFVSALSLLWTISYPVTFQAAWTYVQLLASLWAIREVAQTEEERRRLLIAFCLGVFIPMLSLFDNFRRGLQISAGANRYSAAGQNADTIGSLLVVGIPLAWHLVQTSASRVRKLGLVCLAAAPAGVLLTGARGPFLGGLVALSVIPLSVRRTSVSSLVRLMLLVIVIAVPVVPIVPQAVWERIGTIPREVFGGGTLTTRRDLWAVGLESFPSHPLLGVGAGTYGVLLQNAGYERNPAHNLFIGLLVEQGIIGVSLFVMLLSACGVTITRLPHRDRTMWSVLVLSFVVIVTSQSLENWKVTWVLFGLLAARSNIDIAEHLSSRVPLQPRVDAVAARL